jgi:hypothetical protein
MYVRTVFYGERMVNWDVGIFVELAVFLLFLIIWFLRLLALRPLLAYCASLG